MDRRRLGARLDRTVRQRPMPTVRRRMLAMVVSGPAGIDAADGDRDRWDPR